MKSEIVDAIDLFLCRKTKIPLITVFYNTKDFPGKYVARLFNMDKPTPYCVVRDSLEGIRTSIPSNLMNIGRQPEDDPVIVEVWV